jgi:eukaryotic-like serine/threonine-protein kinase
MTDDRHSQPPSENPDPQGQSDTTGSSDPTMASDPNATMDTGGLGESGLAEILEKPGSQIGRYKLMEIIGEGGFGTVFMAEQLEPVSRRVAFKIIKLGMDTKQVIGRFEAERQALAMMDHAGIAKVFDAGTTETGRPYFVMELVKGVPITTYCDQNRLDTKRRLELFKQVCSAVQHAHQKGVIHRDIKPSNVLVSDAGGQAEPKVIDFGIAKATNQRLTEKTVFTQQAQFIGTPAYMSPEQAGVTAMDIDTRSDIYSLGVLLYELLSGATPFDGEKLRSAGYGELQRIIREEEPPWPSTRASGLGDLLTKTAEQRRVRGAQLVKNLKGELDWIVMKCLEKDRTRRYETANGLSRDVDRFLGNEPVAASPPSKTYRLQKLIVRNRAVFAAGAAMVVLLASGVVGTSIGLVRARQAEKEAVSEAMKSEQVAGFLTDMLAGVGPSASRGRDTEMLEEILLETHERISVELAGQPEVEGEIRSHLGTTYFDLGQLEKAKEQFQLALELLSLAHGEKNGDVARQYNNIGLVHESLQELEAAEENHRHALAIRREIFGEVHEDIGNNLVNLANLLVRGGRYEEAEPLLLEGLDVLRQLHGDSHEDVAICLNSLGNLMQHLGRYPEAAPYYEEALAVHTETLGEDHPYVITDMVNIGWLKFNTGDFHEASRRFSEAGVLARRVFGDSHPKMIDALKAQARCEQQLGNFDSAEALYREAWDMSNEVFGPEHLSTADVMSDLATCLSEMDRDEESEELTFRVFEMQKNQLGENHPSTLTTLHNMAYAVYERGEYERALVMFQESLDAYDEANGRESKNSSLVINNMGRARRAQGDLDGAVKCFEEAGAIRTAIFGPDHLLVAVSNHDKSLARFAQGRYAVAEELIRGSLTCYVTVLDSTHQAVASGMRLLASTELEQGRPGDALAHVERAREFVVGTKGEDSPRLTEYDVIAAAALGQLGRMDEAATRLKPVLPLVADMKPHKRALVNLDVGRHQALAGDFDAAEKTLLSCYQIFGTDFGDNHPLTQKTVTAVVDLYDSWAEAGSATARSEANRWRGKLGAG